MNISNLGSVDLLIIFIKALLVSPFTYVAIFGLVSMYAVEAIENRNMSQWEQLENEVLIYQNEFSITN